MRYALILLLLTGCGGNTYTHPAKSDIKQDAYECERDAAVLSDRIQARLMQDRCLTAKGWVRR